MHKVRHTVTCLFCCPLKKGNILPVFPKVAIADFAQTYNLYLIDLHIRKKKQSAPDVILKKVCCRCVQSAWLDTSILKKDIAPYQFQKYYLAAQTNSLK